MYCWREYLTSETCTRVVICRSYVSLCICRLHCHNSSTVIFIPGESRSHHVASAQSDVPTSTQLYILVELSSRRYSSFEYSFTENLRSCQDKRIIVAAWRNIWIRVLSCGMTHTLTHARTHAATHAQTRTHGGVSFKEVKYWCHGSDRVCGSTCRTKNNNVVYTIGECSYHRGD